MATSRPGLSNVCTKFVINLGDLSTLPTLPNLECVDLPLQLPGVGQAPQYIVVKVSEPQSADPWCVQMVV